jgi:hypothetical protein
LTNALGKFGFNGGLLITRGAVVNNGTFVVGQAATPAIWDVRAGVTSTFIGGDLIGSNASFNQLILTNGPVVGFGIATFGTSAIPTA